MDQTTHLVVSNASQTGVAPADVTLQQMAAASNGSAPIAGSFSGQFDGALGANSGVSINGTVGKGLTAGTTHSLAGATPCTGLINNFTTVANASDAGALPAATLGAMVLVLNNGAHAMAVWPQAADAIDGGTAGVAVTLTNTKRGAWFYCTAANTWESALIGAVSS